ncbi:hypothetical protein K4L06_06315 [Lysobacter sp. BMK333-48F3]|uniref:hypothetical protein n=1 Tax=Lysobacter sp. BMK333-48F3 TaxID=2867962 RepID=UPI001C8C2D9D|nr:hypothetical protein [Lysobacter sp. BMK333-48F3]MBX9400920.1 hypothetical protein [Lysobacter sp. BMK333-48F3]
MGRWTKKPDDDEGGRKPSRASVIALACATALAVVAALLASRSQAEGTVPAVQAPAAQAAAAAAH